MDKFIRQKTTNLKAYIIPILVVSVVFSLLGFAMIHQVKRYYFDRMEQLSVNLAKVYSNSVSKALMADEIVNELLEDKVLTASEAIALYAGISSYQELKDLAKSLNVDEINVFDSQGILNFSNSEFLVGWQAYVGHPIYEFIHSDQTRMVESIRANVVTGIFYKYGYFKTTEGHIFQIGVLADKIQPFLNQFETSFLIEELLLDNKVERVYFINNDLEVTHSTQTVHAGKMIDDHDVILAINQNEYISKTIAFNQTDAYEVFSPVFVNHSKIGTISITQSLQETKSFIFSMSMLGLGTLFFIYLIIIYSFRVSYLKQKQLSTVAYFDLLTTLPNKEYLKLYIKERLKSKRHSSLIILNISNFKMINMMFGYEYGDEILKTVSQRLKQYKNQTTELFRFGADRFIIMVDHAKSKGHLHQLAQNIGHELDEPIVFQSIKKYLTLQVGIIELINHYQDDDQLLKDALITLNYASTNQSCNILFYDSSMQEQLQREEQIETELREIIEQNDQNRLQLLFQPEVDATTQEIIGFEALARIHSRTFGLILPSEFIPIAERSQLIIPLGQQVLVLACQFLNQLSQRGYKQVKIAVNISGIQLMQDDFVEKTIDIVNDCQCNQGTLVLEITESVLLENFDEINNKLQQLSDYQIEIALDDFGSGYSSLLRLGELNAHLLKIDRSFIHTIMIKKHSNLIIDEIIKMAHKFNLKVVAEGVESITQREYLIRHKCDILQGYYYSEPVDQTRAFALLQENNT